MNPTIETGEGQEEAKIAINRSQTLDEPSNLGKSKSMSLNALGVRKSQTLMAKSSSHNALTHSAAEFEAKPAIQSNNEQETQKEMKRSVSGIVESKAVASRGNSIQQLESRVRHSYPNISIHSLTENKSGQGSTSKEVLAAQELKSSRNEFIKDMGQDKDEEKKTEVKAEQIETVEPEGPATEQKVDHATLEDEKTAEPIEKEKSTVISKSQTLQSQGNLAKKGSSNELVKSQQSVQGSLNQLNAKNELSKAASNNKLEKKEEEAPIVVQKAESTQQLQPRAKSHEALAPASKDEPEMMVIEEKTASAHVEEVKVEEKTKKSNMNLAGSRGGAMGSIQHLISSVARSLGNIAGDKSDKKTTANTSDNLPQPIVKDEAARSRNASHNSLSPKKSQTQLQNVGSLGNVSNKGSHRSLNAKTSKFVHTNEAPADSKQVAPKSKANNKPSPKTLRNTGPKKSQVANEQQKTSVPGPSNEKAPAKAAERPQTAPKRQIEKRQVIQPKPIEKKSETPKETKQGIKSQPVAHETQRRKESKAAKQARIPAHEDAKELKNLVKSLRQEVRQLKEQIAGGHGGNDKESSYETEIEEIKNLIQEDTEKSTRLLLNRQKKAYLILIARLRNEVKRLKFQRSSLADPLLEVKYFPYLPRTNFGNSPRKPPVGIIGNTAPKSTDYFVMNPPPAAGTHPEGGHRWWWGDKPRARPNAAGKHHEEVIEEEQIELGDKVVVDVDDQKVKGTNFDASRLSAGVVKYVGSFDGAPSSGLWCGVRLDFPAGRHDGIVKGKRYFTCEENHGFFTRVDRVKKIPRY